MQELSSDVELFDRRMTGSDSVSEMAFGTIVNKVYFGVHLLKI